jgi:hypothetical protein
LLHSHAIAPAQFVGPGNAPHFLIRAAKPSHTAGTLCDIKSEIYGNGGIRAAEEKVGKIKMWYKYIMAKAEGENNGKQKKLDGNAGGNAGNGGCFGWLSQ